MYFSIKAPASLAAPHCAGYVWLSLLPIVAGCSLSAMKELSFSWPGFNNAMYSNVGMVMRNILSKKLLAGFKVRLGYCSNRITRTLVQLDVFKGITFRKR